MKTNEIKIFVHHSDDIKKEGYQIETDFNKISIIVSSYPGFVYSLETLSQIIKDGKYPIGKVED